MNLYNLHVGPESLHLFAEAYEYVPELFWDKYKDNPEKLKEREKAISVDTQYAYCYAVLMGPFPEGEEAISKEAFNAYWYAEDVLKGPFPLGEEAISKDECCAHWYTKEVLKADFYYDGKLIAKFGS